MRIGVPRVDNGFCRWRARKKKISFIHSQGTNQAYGLTYKIQKIGRFAGYFTNIIIATKFFSI